MKQSSAKTKKTFFITAIISLLVVSNSFAEEIDKTVAMEEIQRESIERASKIFVAMDVDGDGSISKEEFINFHSKLVEKRIEKFMPANNNEEANEPEEEIMESEQSDTLDNIPNADVSSDYENLEEESEYDGEEEIEDAF